MLRDPNKAATYFENYLMAQKARIEKFSDKLQELISNGGQASKIQQCHRFLSNFLHDMMYAQYSLGCDIHSLTSTFNQYLTHIRAQESLTYQESLNIISWAILLHIPVQDILEQKTIPNDMLLQTLIEFHIKGSFPTPYSDFPLLFPETSTQFMLCLSGKLSADGLRHYIETEWYQDHSDTAWFDSAKRDDDTYCGYWCFTGAAIAVAMGFDRATFQNTEFFPIDLLP